MKIIIALVAAAAVALLCAIAYVHSGIYDVAASSQHGGIAEWFLSSTSRASVERRAEDIAVPDLDDDALALAGINDFNSMCAGCHGAPGNSPDAAGQGLNPAPPDLAQSAADMTPAQLFWVTKHGIRMTGMPAWGATHDDDSIWPVVAFMTRLPGMDEAGYQEMLGAASGHGHHADEGDSEGHSHDDGGSAPAGNVHVHDDGSSHVHEAANPDVDAIVAIINAIKRGWEEADGTPFREHFLDFEGARYIETGGQNEGLTDLVEHHVEPEGDALESLELSFSNIETHIEGDLAWALADVEVKAVVRCDGRVIDNRGYETFLFRRLGDEWKVIHTHSSTRPVRRD